MNAYISKLLISFGCGILSLFVDICMFVFPVLFVAVGAVVILNKNWKGIVHEFFGPSNTFGISNIAVQSCNVAHLATLDIQAEQGGNTSAVKSGSGSEAVTSF